MRFSKLSNYKKAKNSAQKQQRFLPPHTTKSVGKTTSRGLKALKAVEAGAIVICLCADLTELCLTIDGLKDKHQLSAAIDQVIEGIKSEKQRGISMLEEISLED